MKKILLLFVMFCWFGMHASAELPRDVLAHDYHTRELSKVWYHDRFARPAYIAGGIGLVSFLSSLFIMHELGVPEDMHYAAAFSSAIAAGCFVGSWAPLCMFKFFLRWFIKNPEEEGLRQTLAILSSRLKNAIANGQITAEELELYCAGIESPLVSELIQYARALRASQVQVTWTMDDCNHFV